MNRFLLAALALAVALAGCTGGDEADDGTPTTSTPATGTPATSTPATSTPPVTTTPPPNGTGDGLTNQSYTLSAVGIPAQVEIGRTFNFTLFVNGSPQRVSDHVGAHFADNATVSPPGAGRRDCEHPGGAVPGVFVVNCTITQVGTWHVFGHVRLNESGTLHEYWAAPAAVKVRTYELTVSGFPTSPQVSNQSFTFTLRINGTENLTSDHIGAHVFNASVEQPTVAQQVPANVGSCVHVAGPTVGEYEVTCTIANRGASPATYHVRGHLRITEGGVQTNFWSEAHEVTGLPGLV